MTDIKYNLLEEPLIGVRLSDGKKTYATLPEVMAMLAAGDDIAAFTGLQRHQFHAWYAFLVQLGAIGLHQAGNADLVQSKERWTSIVLAATENRREPWCLCVPDVTAPAFMQPPVPDGSLTRFTNRFAWPDLLDILVTTKNHDVKSARISGACPEFWLYALVSLQTMQGYSGRGNFGIARMNSGYGNRPYVSYATGTTWGHRFRRDVSILVGERSRLLAGDYGFRANGGVTLVWLEPWDGTESMSVTGCDPFFIEVCRRVRLVEDDGHVVAVMAPTLVARIKAGDGKGNTGDPWTPIRREDGAALTVGASGFNYDLVHKLLFGGDYQQAVAATLQPGDPDEVILVATAMTRGQGKTEGLHQRVLRIPARIRLRLGKPDQRDQLANFSRRRIEASATVRRFVLSPALRVLLQGAPDNVNQKDDRIRRWLDAWDAEVDGVFFLRLWEDAELDDTEADRRWERVVLDLALTQLKEAIGSVPLPAARRYKAIAVSERVFYASRRKHFPEFTRESEEVGTSERH